MSINLKSVLAAFLLFAAQLSYAQDVLPQMKDIPAGYFWMGSSGWGEDYDEAPVHKVVITDDFRMSSTEITNLQYEQFCPEHSALRGKLGFSTGDNDAVVNVSYEDAMAYCKWLSERTGRAFRLPTEAEWEYACRAGSYLPYFHSDKLTPAMSRSQKTERNMVVVSLETGTSEQNPFGLSEMHGNVEEWCFDWYAPYCEDDQVNPAGPSTGEFRVTRGGSHNTPAAYLRSANRSAAIPSDKHWQLGFRVVESSAKLNYVKAESGVAVKVSQKVAKWAKPLQKPFWIPPIPYVHKPVGDVPFYSHNHQPALTWCDNGDMIAIWFSCDVEAGREMVVLSSRLRKGSDSWSEPQLFYKVPDRNMTGSSLLHLPDGRIMHMNGVSNAGDWKYLAMSVRFSDDNGQSWSAPKFAAAEHAQRHQVIAGPIVTSDGRIIQCCDAGPGGNDGTAIHVSSDGGLTWSDPWDGSPLPEFKEGASGSTIAGIHASVVELGDGSLMALGRGNSIVGTDGKKKMPMSMSSDGGRTWTYSATDFTPIDGGQRLVLMRLAEGPLMLVSFTDHPMRTPVEDRGLDFNGGKGYGMFVALSYDDGKSWPVRKLMTDGVERMLDGGAWTRGFVMDATHAEPRGYLAGVQTPDGTIHIISSRLHYRFNLAWVLE